MDLAALAQHWELYTVRQLPDGTVIGVQRMLFTWSLLVEIGVWEYERRYCYKYHDDAIEACMSWDGKGAPPGPWIKEKPSGKKGPGATSID